jgi:hypothetical protein
MLKKHDSEPNPEPLIKQRAPNPKIWAAHLIGVTKMQPCCLHFKNSNPAILRKLPDHSGAECLEHNCAWPVA